MQESWLLMLLHDEQACAGFETKKTPPLITNIDTAVVVINAKLLVRFIAIALTNYSNYYMHI